MSAKGLVGVIGKDLGKVVRFGEGLLKGAPHGLYTGFLVNTGTNQIRKLNEGTAENFGKFVHS